MSFDAQIAELNTNIKALIAALGAASTGGASAAADTGTASTTAGKTGTRGKKDADKKAGPTREEMVAALTEVKEKFGAAEAKAIISKVGAAKMAEIADDKIQSAFTLAKAKLEASAADETDPEDDGL